MSPLVLLWLAPRCERFSPEARADAREGGFYVVAEDGSHTGPFAVCPPHPADAARVAEIQLLLAQEPRP